MSSEEGRWVQRLELPEPALGDNVADADRIEAALAERLGETPEIDLDLLRLAPGKLRAWGYAARCTCFRDHRWHLIGLHEPEGRPVVGVAVDLGTTTLVLSCLDLESGEVLAEGDLSNPQLSVAPDILDRIHYADGSGGLEKLRALVVEGINSGLDALCQEAGVERSRIALISVAGNTAMTHLFLGLEPRWLIREPYIPVANSFGMLRARELGIRAGAGAGVYVFPNVGAYFGGDLIAGILSSGLHRRAEPALLVDVGTNAEVVLGGSDWLLACAGAAGPALEGGAAAQGMMAGPGVIDRVELDGEALRLHTIDGGRPVGICGSGLIDLAASLFRRGVLDVRGELVPKAWPSRVLERDGIVHFVVVPASESATGEELTLSQPEVDSLIRSKAAMFTILETITSSVGLAPEDIERFYVAGTFGSLIDPLSAITIGMLPDLPLEAFTPLGNSSLAGASLALTTPTAIEESAKIRDSVTYLELNVNQDFMNRFSAAKFLPHTDRGRFTSVAH